MVLRDSETEYLTTYDIQPILEQQGNKLSKVELNNWLSTLQDAGLVQKAVERGKPTTRPYDRRYTFDLWKLSEKGQNTAKLLEVFHGNTPIQIKEKVVTKTVEKIIEVPKFPKLKETSLENLGKITSLFIHLSLLSTLKKNNKMDLYAMSEETGLTARKIVDFINQENSRSNPLYQLEEIPLDLRGKLMEKIGLSPKKNYVISPSPFGVELLSKLSP